MNEVYIPLYRKYRPQKIDDIVGQEHIKRSLKNAITQQKIAHAYLFTGPRGTGKTSTARILAKSLNCIDGPTLTPCEKCESCKSITNTIPIDVIEIDAASNNKVDDAHDILEKVNYAPVNGKYKIYIIDEVHMLTVGAFNALLKTLEEPPKNVIFILATTEAHKVLDTIKSRCQRFDFKRITTEDIISHLKSIAQKENINITDEAITIIAKNSAGGMRDSLALLDQASIIGNTKEITEDDINNLLGRISFDTLYELTTNITNSDSASAIKLMEKIYNNGNEPIQILQNLMLFFKNLLIIKNTDLTSAKIITELNENQIKIIQKITDNIETQQIVLLINKTTNYIKELKETTNQELWLEVSIIDLANMTENTKLLELEQRLSNIETGNPTIKHTTREILLATEPQNKSVNKPKTDINNDNNNTTEKKSDEIITSDTCVDISNNKDLDSLWVKILQTLLKDNISGLASMKAFTMLSKCENEMIEIICKTSTYADKLNLPEKKKKLAEAIYSVIGQTDAPIIIRAKTKDDSDIKKIKLSQTKTKSVIPQEIKEDDYSYTNKDETTDDSSEEEDVTLKNESFDNIKDEKDGLTEQTSMIKNIFDGKVLE